MAWGKDNTKRLFALSGQVHLFTDERIQQTIGNGLVGNDAVFQILRTCSRVQVE